MKLVSNRRSSSQRITLIVVAIGLLAVIGVEIGYLSHKSSTKSSSPTTVGTTLPSTPPTSVIPVPTTKGRDPVAPLPTYVNQVSLRPDVSTTSCAASPGGWTASGLIDNTLSSAHDFRLTVYFTDAHATVLSAGQTSVTVPSQGKQPWSITSKFDAPPGVVCVLVGVG